MIYPSQQFINLRLLVRNEGKLKSYESCNDLRAWSHDDRQRDLYLREWMKSDMPFCVMPACTLAGLLRGMTCRNRGRAAPRCHPDCRSKILLDSICTSCHAMKECFRNNEHFEKYFIEEELETSHWPCERCLDALKSIKMFWKVIVEKLFNINLTKTESEAYETEQCCRNNNPSDVARTWQRDIVHQALFVKTCTPVSCNASKTRLGSACGCKKTRPVPNCPSNFCKVSKKESCYKIIKPPSTADCAAALSRMSSRNKINFNKQKCRCTGDNASILSCKGSRNPSCKSHKNRVTISDHVTYSNACDKPRHKHCRCTSVRVRTMDMSCNTCDIERESAEIKAYKINLEYLQKNFDMQKDELDNLKRENNNLKLEMQNMRKSCKWRSTLYCPGTDYPHQDIVALVPKPFECFMEESACSSPAKDIDSEMIITMKNCKNETFRHISLLQVLHKTNESIPVELDFEGPCYKKEDPINLLTKVQKALGAIVRREMSLASEKKEKGREFDIDATFQKVNSSRSAPSCVTLLSC